MTDEAKALRNAYQREWRKKNKDHVNAYHKKWRQANPDKVRANTTRYWEKKAKEKSSN